ncbi:MAG TPA: AzlD domain-containing protein [Actinomycetota bacterium]|nr:AzlD domain-containing protein [Actinomycetota bacterium]
MSSAWTIVVAVGAATVALKALGPVLLGGRQLPTPALAAIGLLAPALLAALVITQVVDGPDGLTVDARALGLTAAVVALLLRAPTLLVIVAAAAVTACGRLIV